MFKTSIFGSNKSSSSSSASKTITINTQRDIILEQLISIFPDADQEYLNYCIGFYRDNHVERISEKIFNYNKGHYPKVPKGCTNANSIEAKNSYLLQLNDLFPECDISFLRDCISNQNNNHVHQITEMLLNMEKSSQQKAYPKRIQPFVIEDWELIRSPQYRKAVRYRLYNDFPDIWKSTIKAVLAENNFDYRKSYDKLKDLSHNNSYWWNSIFSVFKRKKYIDIDDKDLISEVYKLKSLQLDELSRNDHKIAKQINFTEYTQNNQLITCGCCYGDYPFEDFTCCNEGHLFCKECINHLVQEGLYGQGSLRGKIINCIDSSSPGDDGIGAATSGGCNGYFTEEKLKSCLNPDLFKRYAESLIEHSLKQSNLLLIQCPFCPYCEADDDDDDPFRQIKIPKTFIIISSVPLALLPFFTSFENVMSALNVVAIIVIPQIFLSLLGLFPIKTWFEDFDNIVKRVKRKRRGNIFKCRNPECNKVSCLLCNRESRPFHKCYEQEQDSLRLYVERAMAEAVKRTCPKCHVSFTKADGCNKMTCRCGYVMCYLCRKDLRQESYAHFCDHFRPIPGQKCKKCNKCDLYKTEDEEKVVKEAAAKARAEYIKLHPEARDVNLLENTAIGPIKNDGMH
ncbi:19894_t:CDS:2 [Entrophospora sp. SA101]|nr:19894_t:CDS:2 [Entrophospora sp. SA101]